MFDKSLKKRFVNTYKFSKLDIKKLVLSLGTGIYPYKNMHD